MLLKKKSSIFGQVSLKELLDMPGNVQKLGNAIIDAGQTTQEIETSINNGLDSVNQRLTDNLILTEHQKRFLKQHKESKL
jgi:hypothetical protein